ncbi:hypothetical protein JXO59_09375 [candidate division KSB1 bacterium]|nr:hypothetical protein [candidate division KSB1 bacterium]
MPFPQIHAGDIKTRPLAQRKSKTNIEDIAADAKALPQHEADVQKYTRTAAERILTARRQGAAVILMFGAHLIKNGAGPILIKMMEHGWVTHLATQGAGCIHDWEFAFQGRSEEDVRQNVASGQFGTWDETGRYLNLAVQVGAIQNMGFGESIGAMIEREALTIPDSLKLGAQIADKISGADELSAAEMELYVTLKKFDLKSGTMIVPHPYKQFSVFAAAHRFGIPITVHGGIGYDIFYAHPFANGAALGRGSHTDFQIFCHSVSGLVNGVVLSTGSAVMAPQVFEKAMSIANNVRLQRKQAAISGHHIFINDLQPLTYDWQKGEPPRSLPDYYLRFLKSFYRMGGSVAYIAADNRLVLHHLYQQLKKR